VKLFSNCTKCDLHKTRQNIVFGEGPVPCDLMLVGEAPGKSEDEWGHPFCGESGQLLNQMLLSVGLDRKNIYITNICKCIPPASKVAKKSVRPPKRDEIDACFPYFEQEIQAVKPKLIILAGNVALKAFYKDNKLTITKHHGIIKYSEKYQVHTLSIFHPAAVLRHPEYMHLVIEDLQKAKQFLQTGEVKTEKVQAVFVNSFDKAKKLLTKLTTIDFTYDLETTDLNFRTDKIICFGFGINTKKGFCLPWLTPEGNDYWTESQKSDLLDLFKKVFNSPYRKVAHNGKFDNKFLMKLGIEVNNFYFDTLLAHYLLDENAQGMHSLKDLARRYTPYANYELPLDEYIKKQKSKSFLGIPYDILSYYNCADVVVTYYLWKVFEPKLQKLNLTPLFRKILIPLSKVYADLEYRGIQVDIKYLNSLKTELTQKAKDIEQKIFESAGEINLRSPQQLRELLFKKLKLKPVKESEKGNYATDEETLTVLASKHEIPKLILEYRKTYKMLSTYVLGIEELLDENNRVHTNYLLHGTTTGRMSSQAPNLQNIPRDSDIRNLFTAPKGMLLCQGDYSQAELRGLAQYSKDEQLIHDLITSPDFHKQVASYFFGKPFESITKEERTVSKTIIFGLIYGRSAWSVAKQLGIEEREAKQLINKFFAKYPRVQQWISNIQSFVKQYGFVKSFFGRYRRLPGIKIADKKMYAEALRQAVNSPIQSLAADITNYAAIRLDSIVKEYNAHFVANVHDSLLYEVPEEHIYTVARIIKTEMERPIKGFIIKFPVEIKIGKHWGSLEVWEDKDELVCPKNGKTRANL